MARHGELNRFLLSALESVKPVAHEALELQTVDVTEKVLLLTSPFETSFGRFDRMTKFFPVLSFKTLGGDTVQGVGEGTPLPYPWYDGESDATVRTVLQEYILPALRSEKKLICSVYDLQGVYGKIVGHNMAKTAIEGAYWDALGKLHGVPVSSLWDGTRREVESGTSVGLEKSPEAVVAKVDRAVEMGVKRVKVKIAPGRDIEFVAAIRNRHPDLPLQVDGNAAYDLFSPKHVSMLRALDQFNLLMIEQPGPNDDRFYHRELSRQLKTPICLDESILHARHAIEVIQMWAEANIMERLVVNIKPPRVGGFWEGVKIAKICELVGVPTWCGGMLESALGKAANVHFSSLKAVDMPGDHVSQGAYYQKDVATPLPYKDGVIEVPQRPGWGVDLTLD